MDKESYNMTEDLGHEMLMAIIACEIETTETLKEVNEIYAGIKENSNRRIGEYESQIKGNRRSIEGGGDGDRSSTGRDDLFGRHSEIHGRKSKRRSSERHGKVRNQEATD